MLRALLIMVICAVPLVGQSSPTITLGDRVRIVAPEAGYRKLTGSVIATTPDVIAISLDRTAVEVSVARNQIEELLVSTSSRRHVVAGTGAGAALGGGIAFFFGPRENMAPGSTIGTGRRSTKNVITGTLVGASLGALVGYLAKTDTWVQASAR